MSNIRKAAVAGMFYPGRKDELTKLLNSLMNNAPVTEKFNDICGIVSPHAGYAYSGLSAAFGYNVLKEYDFETAVILSPSHREYFTGLSVYDGDAYETPLGAVEIDKELRGKLIGGSSYFFEGPEGHGAEHAVEVQLPFLQMIKEDLRIVPIVIGDQRKIFIDELTKGLSNVTNDKVIVIVSSDLSHFYSRDIADKLDSIVEKHIVEIDSENLQKDLETKQCEACGGGGIVSLLQLAKTRNYKHAKVLSRTDSGDASGDYSSVVGYLSAVVYN